MSTANLSQEPSFVESLPPAPSGAPAESPESAATAEPPESTVPAESADDMQEYLIALEHCQVVLESIREGIATGRRGPGALRYSRNVNAA